MQDVQEVYNFVRKCPAYFIATYDKETQQPRVRPFTTFHIFEGKIYIQTGKKKDVSKQMISNPKIEISALHGRDKWIRIDAVPVEDPRLEAQQSMLDAFPTLADRYAVNDGNMQVFYLKDVTATIYSFSGEPKTYKF